MELKKLMVDTKSVWVDFTGIDGFSVEVVNLSRKELTALRKKCTTTKFNRRTRQPEENLDEDKFVTEFSNASIKNWKGLTLEKLQDTSNKLRTKLSDIETNESFDSVHTDEYQKNKLFLDIGGYLNTF